MAGHLKQYAKQISGQTSEDLALLTATLRAKGFITVGSDKGEGTFDLQVFLAIWAQDVAQLNSMITKKENSEEPHHRYVLRNVLWRSFPETIDDSSLYDHYLHHKHYNTQCQVLFSRVLIVTLTLICRSGNRLLRITTAP